MDIYDIEAYLTGVVSEALEDLEDRCNCQNIAAQFPEYNPDYCATDFTRNMENRRNTLVDTIVTYLTDTLFYNY